jgi:hypothetical protein
MVFFVLCFLCVQYLVRQWLNENKISTVTEGDNQLFTLQATVMRVRIAKIISSNITFLILFVLLLIEQCGIGTLFFYYFGAFPDTFPSYISWLGYANGIAHGAVFFTAMGLAFLADVIVDIKKFGLFKGYYQRDPLNYRVDFIFIALVLVFVIIFSSVNLAPYSYATYVVGTIFNFFFRLCMILASGLSCHIVIIKRFITKQFITQSFDEKSVSRSDLMLAVLSHTKGKEIFEMYCTSELSIENFKAYFDLLIYQELTERDKKEYMCRVVYYKYVQSNALMEVNMPNYTRVKIKNAVENIESQDLDTIFDDLITEVRANLTDTFARFQVTDMYRKFRRRSSFTKMVSNKPAIPPLVVPPSPVPSESTPRQETASPKSDLSVSPLQTESLIPENV